MSTSVGKSTTNELIDALLDVKVIDALGKALGSTIAKTVEERVEAKLAMFVDKISTLEKNLSMTSDVAQKLQVENKQLRERLDDLDTYSRGDNLIIHGLEVSSYSEAAAGSQLPGGASAGKSSRSSNRRTAPVQTAVTTNLTESSEVTELKVIEFANKVMNIPLTRDDISVAHRLAKRPGANTPAPIIVRFSNRRARNAVYNARLSLKTLKPAIYVNEHLIRSRAKILKDARQLVKDKKLQGAWTNNGVVYIRLSDLPDSKPIQVNNINDLPRG